MEKKLPEREFQAVKKYKILKRPIYSNGVIPFRPISLDELDDSEIICSKNQASTCFKTKISSERTVFVKIYTRSWVEREDIILNEVAALKKLHNCENVVQFYWMTSDEMCLGMFFEYCDGGSVEKIIFDGPLEEDFKYNLIQQAANGLAYIHERKVIHRDIRPANFFLAGNTLKIGGFEMAEDLSAGNANRRSLKGEGKEKGVSYIKGNIVGHSDYLAPELFIDFYSCDVYAFGISMFEIWKGKRYSEEESLNTEFECFIERVIDKKPHFNINEIAQLLEKKSFGLDDVSQIIVRTQSLKIDDSIKQQLAETDDKSSLEQGQMSIIENVDQMRSLELESAKENTSILILNNHNILIYNSKEEIWESFRINLPSEVRLFGMSVLNDELYIFGGSFHSNHCYKLENDGTWKRLADMLEIREDIENSSIVFQNEIWVIGGYNYINKHLKSVEKYNSETNKWTLMQETIYENRYPMATVLNGKIYVMSGRFYSKCIEVFDPEIQKWMGFCDIPFKFEYNYLLTFDGNLLLFCSQFVGNTYFNPTWKLNPNESKKRWTLMPNFNVTRNYFKVVNLLDKVMVFGGDIERNSCEIFDGNKWTEGPKYQGIMNTLYTTTTPLNRNTEEKLLKEFSSKNTEKKFKMSL